MSWLKRVLGRGRSTELSDGDLSCSFCGRHRREVRKLVAGPQVTICDDCIVLCNQILDDEAYAAREVGYHAGAMLAGVAQLGPLVPYARARPILRAVIELGRGHRSVLRAVMVAALEIDDVDTAVAAVRAIAAADRTAMDAIDLGGMLADLRHPDEALAALAAVEPAALEGVAAILHDLHGLQARLERGGLAAAEVATIRGHVTELETATSALPAGATEDGVRARRLAVMTLAALAGGALDAAERAARAHLAARPGSPVAHDHVARVLTARGDDGGARAIRAAGLAFVHPESVYAARLRANREPRPFR